MNSFSKSLFRSCRVNFNRRTFVRRSFHVGARQFIVSRQTNWALYLVAGATTFTILSQIDRKH
jgi:hypothetical protein